MTNIIYDIFVKRNNATQALIVKSANDILNRCFEFATVINDAHNVERLAQKNDDAKAGTDALRDAIIADGHFAWLYDDTGKPNKKGICKPTMSDGMRSIRKGMVFLADENNADLFLAWAESKPNKKGVCDFANIKTAIQPKAEKTASDASESDGESDAEQDAAASDTDAKRSKEEFLDWVFNQAFTEFGMDSADFLEFITSEKTAKIADKYTKAA